MNNSKAGYLAFDTAVYLLTYKNRTKREIADKLKEKGYSEAEIDKALKKLTEYNFVNDESYTLSYIKSNMNKKGKKLICMELAQKGIDKDTTEAKLEELCVYEREEENIDAIFQKRFVNSDLEDMKVRNKILSYFLRRGFSLDKISKIVKNYRENSKTSDYYNTF